MTELAVITRPGRLADPGGRLPRGQRGDPLLELLGRPAGAVALGLPRPEGRGAGRPRALPARAALVRAACPTGRQPVRRARRQQPEPADPGRGIGGDARRRPAPPARSGAFGMAGHPGRHLRCPPLSVRLPPAGHGGLPRPGLRRALHRAGRRPPRCGRAPAGPPAGRHFSADRRECHRPARVARLVGPAAGLSGRDRTARTGQGRRPSAGERDAIGLRGRAGVAAGRRDGGGLRRAVRSRRG